MTIDLETLKQAVKKDAALRRIQRLQPVGGASDKVFPSTYPGEGNNDPARHVFETRRINGNDVRCVLLDSVQSQANRLEEALLTAMRAKKIFIPHIAVDFNNKKVSISLDTGSGKNFQVAFGKGTEYDLSDIGEITSLDAPHRIFDAIIRDSELDHKRFEETPLFKNDLMKAKPTFATPIFGVSPSALLFGVWHSTGKGGGLGAKFARCIVSEIVGVGASPGRRVSSRIDPLGIQDVPIYQDKSDPSLWTANPENAQNDNDKPKLFPAPRGKKSGRPSLINHSNVMPSVTGIALNLIGEKSGFQFLRDREHQIEFVAKYPEAQYDDLLAVGGVTIDYALHTAVISFAGLRRLKFPETKDETAGRTVLASLALVAMTEQDSIGYALRSRCDLVCDGKAPFEIVHQDGSTEEIEINADDAVKVFKESVSAAKNAGFPWDKEPVRLKPQERLVELVALSRAKALSGEAESDNPR